MDDKKQLIKRMRGLFDGLNRAYGVYNITGKKRGDKVGGKAQTVVGTVRDELWAQHLSGVQGLGIVPIRDDSTVTWGAIDVDEYDISLVQLEKDVEDLKLPLTICRTKSGGAHLYLFLTEPATADLVRAKLGVWSTVLGRPGIEIFPKQTQLASDNDVGNWLNMPYFSAKDTNRFAILNGERLSLREFLDLAESRRVSPEYVQELKIELDEELEGAPPCLQVLVQKGFPEGGRNNGLFNLGVYARLRFGDEWKQHMEDYNRDYIDPPLPSEEVVGLAKSLGKKDYFYQCKQPPISQFCNKDLCREACYGITVEDSGHEIALDNLTKILTDPPQWVATVDGRRISLTTDDLFNQQRFRRACLEAIHKFPRKYTSGKYEGMIQRAMDEVTIVEVPEDALPEGQFEHYLAEFCALPGAKNRDELLMGKPWTDNGRIYFRSPDLLSFLEQERFRGISPQRIYPLLKEVNGARHHSFMIKNRHVRCWSITELELQSEAFDVTTTEDPLEF